MTAFKNLPPWGDFVKGRDSDMLHMRLDFTRGLEQLHRRTLANDSALKTPELEQAAQEAFRAARRCSDAAKLHPSATGHAHQPLSLIHI